MRSSVINNERGSVISDNNYGTNDYDYSNIIERREGEEEGGGATHFHTLTHSLNPSHFLSLTIITFNNLHHIYNLDNQNYFFGYYDH